MQIPIACSLEASDARAQLEAWKEIFALRMTSVNRVAPCRFEISFRPEASHLGALVQLAQREKACCAFFDFTLVIESTSTTFVVEVPDDAREILDHFIAAISQ